MNSRWVTRWLTYHAITNLRFKGILCSLTFDSWLIQWLALTFSSRQGLNCKNDLIKVQQYEENEFLQLIKEEQHRTKKAVDIVDVRKKFHLKQLQKKSKINTIFRTTSSVVTIVILAIAGILLYKFCLRNSHRQQSNTCHFNRIEERIQLGQLAIKENPIANKPTQIDDSNETSMTEVDNRNIGTTIRLSDIIRNES